LRRADANPDALMLGAVQDFRPGEWALLLGVAVACAMAVVKGRRYLLIQVQGWSLAAGLLLTQLNLGTEVGEKVDPRLGYALMAGVASLHCCYLCLAAYVTMAIRSARDGLTSSRT
jgi:hypothetical protein